MKRKCELCGEVLAEDYLFPFCRNCSIKHLKEMIGKPDAIHFDAWDMSIILDLDEAESVKRLARKDKLPPRIPGIKKFLWMPEVVYDWLVSGYKAMKETTEEEKALKLALKTGTPIEQVTLYGHYPQGLLEWYREETSRGH